MRDLSVKPYSEDELRVCEYLQSIAPQIGCGDDPVGFIISSHHAVMEMNKELKNTNASLILKMRDAMIGIEKAMEIIDSYKKLRS